MHISVASSLCTILLARAVAADKYGMQRPDTEPVQSEPVFAAPFNLDTLRTTHSVHEVASGKIGASDLLLNAYRRYNVTPPTTLVHAAAAARQSGSVSAMNTGFDFQYLAPVTVGKQQMLLNFDTGSSDLWVYSKLLPKSQRGNHTIYQLSKTKVPPTDEAWDISYVDGSGAKGVVYADNVTIGGVTATVAVEAATSVSASFVTQKADGLVGLAFDDINTCNPDQCYTFMHQVMDTLPSPLFAATLRKGKPGTYDFGFIDSTKYTGSIGYTTVDNSLGEWGLYPTAYQIGSTGPKKSTSFYTIADTGTSLAILPSDIVTEYYSKIPGSFYNSQYGFYFWPCSSHVPNFSLYLGSHKATLPGSYINAGPTGLNDGNCFGLIKGDDGFPNSILGDSFLKSQYVVFDFNGPRLGFAQQKGIPTS